MCRLFIALFLSVAVIFSIKLIYAARFFPDQLPLSIPLNPDQNRPMGRCNANSDCPAGSNCNAFGTCD